jgi:hypothetical protein
MPPQKIKPSLGSGGHSGIVTPHRPALHTGSGQTKLTPSGHSRQASGTGQSLSRRHWRAIRSLLVLSIAVSSGPVGSEATPAQAPNSIPVKATIVAFVQFKNIASLHLMLNAPPPIRERLAAVMGAD